MSKLILPAGMRLTNPADAAHGWERVHNPGMPDELGQTFLHRGRQLVAIRSHDDGRWHLSVSHRDRVPSWGELGFARDGLLPEDVWLMVPHPPRRFWMNLNPKVLHLWEFRDDRLIEQFREEGEHAQREGYGTPDSGEPTA